MLYLCSINARILDTILQEYLKTQMKFSDEECAALDQLANVQHFKKGTVLLKEGQYSPLEYFVLKGCLRAYYIIDGEEKTTEFYTEFEPLSPICVQSKAPSEYYISCMEDAVLLISDASITQQSFEQFPHLERKCLEMTEKVLVKKQIALNSFKTQSPEQRYISLLDSNPDLVQRVPQYHLASYLGITAQSLSRLRNRISNR